MFTMSPDASKLCFPKDEDQAFTQTWAEYEKLLDLDENNTFMNAARRQETLSLCYLLLDIKCDATKQKQ